MITLSVAKLVVAIIGFIIGGCSIGIGFAQLFYRRVISQQNKEINEWKAEYRRVCAERDAHLFMNNVRKAEAIKEYHKKVRHRLLDKGFYPAIVKCVLDEVEEEIVGDV